MLYSDSNLEIYKSIITHNPDGIFVFSIDGTIMETNQIAIKIFGYSEAEMIGRSYKEFMSSIYVEKVNEYFDRVIQGIPLECDVDSFHKDGSIVHLKLKFIPLMVKEEVVEVFCVAKDVTELLKTKASLKNEEQYRRLVELSPKAMIVHQEGRIQYANPASVKLLGASSMDDLIGENILNLSIPEYMRTAKHLIEQLDKTGISVEPMEEKLKRLDGKLIDVEVTGIAIDYDGMSSYLIGIYDLTSRKQAEEALRKSEEKYRLIAENMTDLIRIVDVHGVVKYASPSHEYVLGFKPEVYEGNLILNMLHPDDMPHIETHIREMTMTKKEKLIEFRNKHISGKWKWMEAKVTPVLNKNGNVVHFQVVARDITERKMYEEKLSHLAYHDGLTGLPNRRWFKERLDQAIKEADRNGRKMAVMYMDMDKFKSINDTFGHEVGDILLREFAKRVQGCLREIDALARQGGDEFTVLLPEIEDEQDALQVAERILTCLQVSWHIKNHVFETTSSIGIAFYPSDGTTRHELLRNADEALYQAKQSGRNRLRAYKWA